MEKMQKIGIMILCIAMAMCIVSPVMANGGKDDKQQPIDITVIDPVFVHNDFDPVNDVDVTVRPDIDITVKPADVDITNNFKPTVNVAAPVVKNDIDVDNINNNKNYNTNLNLNINENKNYNNVDVDQSQKQNQGQIQFQDQKQSQKQSQTQANVQTVNVEMPKGADGGLLISNSNKAPTVSQLDVGDAQVISRLVYPGEVLTYEVKNGDVVSLKAASDVGFYTIGYSAQDDMRVSSFEATPGYDPIYHKLTFGFVSPVDRIDFWTTKATLSASTNAKWVVVDNRAPRNSYTHIEISIASGKIVEQSNVIVNTTILKPDVFPVDSHGHAITSSNVLTGQPVAIK